MTSITDSLNGPISGWRAVMCAQHSSVRIASNPAGSRIFSCITPQRRPPETLPLTLSLTQGDNRFKPNDLFGTAWVLPLKRVATVSAFLTVRSSFWEKAHGQSKYK